METVLEKYDASRYGECIDLLRSELDKDDSLMENLIKQNCLSVCRCLLAIAEDDTGSIDEMQMELYKCYQNIMAVSMVGDLVPVNLELNSLFNFLWWTIYYVDYDYTRKSRIKGYLPTIHRGLQRVLGISCKSSSDTGSVRGIIRDMKRIGKKIVFKNYNMVALTVEIAVLVFLFILAADNSKPVVEYCVESVNELIGDMEMSILGLHATKEYENELAIDNKLVKFGLLQINSTVSRSGLCPVDCLHIIQLTCLCMSNKYRDVLNCMRKNLKSNLKALWCYMGSLSAYMLEEFDKSFGFVLMTSGLKVQGMLKSKLSILNGLLLSKREKHSEALRCFNQAKMISDKDAVPLYYMGEEYGKMGLYDEMIECFNAIIKMKEEHKVLECREFSSNFESMILNVIHPPDEIIEAEALYAAAVAHGLTDRFRESAEIFEKYLGACLVEAEGAASASRIIKTPKLVTALHEAATMNLLAGNFFRCERLLFSSSNRYVPTRREQQPPSDLAPGVIHRESSSNSDGEEPSNGFFTEEMVYSLDEDVIGLAIKAEMERIQECETYKITLGRIVTILSKYMGQMQKKGNMSRDERDSLSLVKALSARIFLRIAEYQMKMKSSVEIERTFKRALTCNQGDKDVLHSYYNFLSDSGKGADAGRLWKTFHASESPVVADRCQSLALVFLLKTNATKRDFHSVKIRAESTAMDVDTE